MGVGALGLGGSWAAGGKGKGGTRAGGSQGGKGGQALRVMARGSYCLLTSVPRHATTSAGWLIQRATASKEAVVL